MVVESRCTESCGWLAGFIAALSFGSFGVLVKGKASTKCDVHPLVMQTYKCSVCFLTCWLVLLVGVPLKFSLWGIVSGLFWVPGSIAGIYAIRNAGLAVSVGTWSALNVVSSLIWGIFIFQESVKSKLGTCCGAFVLIFGLVGMSTFSKPKPSIFKEKVEPNGANEEDEGVAATVKDSECEDLLKEVRMNEKVKLRYTVANDSLTVENYAESISALSEDSDFQLKSDPSVKNKLVNVEEGDDNDTCKRCSLETEDIKNVTESDIVNIIGSWNVSRRDLGLIGAIINGTWGGTCLIPMHYAKAEGVSGAGFVISFGCGSMLITIWLWFLLYLFHLARLQGHVSKSYELMPPLHLKAMAIPGVLSGLLYSLGNFCSMIAISYLGQGVGFSFVQLSMLVSGLWGIFYFQEITGKENILKWFSSAILAIIGIIWLSFEHNGSISH